MPLTVSQMMAAVEACLSADLLSAQWRRAVTPNDHPVAGHCAIASEAMYDLLGGAAAGYTPYVCGHNPQSKDALAPGETHWWLQGPKGALRGAGEIVDVTRAQFDGPFPYHAGKPAGFMSPYPPSQRARQLIARVEAMLGADEVAAFRGRQIAAFAAAGGQVALGPADRRRRAELGL